MHQGRGVQQVTGPLAEHARVRDAFKLAVDQLRQLPVAGIPRLTLQWRHTPLACGDTLPTGGESLKKSWRKVAREYARSSGGPLDRRSTLGAGWSAGDDSESCGDLLTPDARLRARGGGGRVLQVSGVGLCPRIHLCLVERSGS